MAAPKHEIQGGLPPFREGFCLGGPTNRGACLVKLVIRLPGRDVLLLLLALLASPVPKYENDQERERGDDT